MAVAGFIKTIKFIILIILETNLQGWAVFVVKDFVAVFTIGQYDELPT